MLRRGELPPPRYTVIGLAGVNRVGLSFFVRRIAIIIVLSAGKRMRDVRCIQGSTNRSRSCGGFGTRNEIMDLLDCDRRCSGMRRKYTRRRLWGRR